MDWHVTKMKREQESASNCKYRTYSRCKERETCVHFHQTTNDGKQVLKSSKTTNFELLPDGQRSELQKYIPVYQSISNEASVDVDVFSKLRVRPIESANLDTNRTSTRREMQEKRRIAKRERGSAKREKSNFSRRLCPRRGPFYVKF